MAKAAGNGNSPHLSRPQWLGARVPPESENVACVQRSPRNARDPSSPATSRVARRYRRAEGQPKRSGMGDGESEPLMVPMNAGIAGKGRPGYGGSERDRQYLPVKPQPSRGRSQSCEIDGRGRDQPGPRFARMLAAFQNWAGALTVPKMGVHCPSGARTLGNRAETARESSGTHRSEVRIVGRLGALRRTGSRPGRAWLPRPRAQRTVARPSSDPSQ